MSLLFLLAATVLIVYFQLSQSALILFGLGALTVRVLQRRMACHLVQLDDGKVSLARGEKTYPVRLVYQNDGWMVVSLPPANQETWLQSIGFFLMQRHQVLYRDQFTHDDYRLVRSTLNVAKFIGQSASTKNGS